MIKMTNFKCIIQLHLSIFILLYSCHYHPSPEICHYFKQKLYSLKNNLFLPHLASDKPLLYFLFRNLSILGNSYEWNHTAYIHLCMASFAWPNVLGIHPYCYVYQLFVLLLLLYIVFYDINMP